MAGSDRQPSGGREWRLALYLVPIVLLVVAAAVDAAPDQGALAALTRVLVVAGLVAVAIGPVREAARAADRPYTVTETRSVLTRVRAAVEPGDVVYVHWTGAVLYDYYATVLGLPERAGYFLFQEGGPCPDGDPVARLRAHPRVWVVFAFPPAWGLDDDAATSLSQFDRLGTRVLQHVAPGRTQAVLYDTRRPTIDPPPPRSPKPDDCFAVVGP